MVKDEADKVERTYTDPETGLSFKVNISIYHALLLDRLEKIALRVKK